MLRQFHSIYDPIVFQSTKLYKKRQKTGYNGPNPLFLLIRSRIKPQLTFSFFFYDLSTFDPCFLLLTIAYTLGAMFGEVCPSDVCSIRIIRPSSFQIKSVTALVWKRPVFQSWAYWCLACAHRGFSFSRRVTNAAFEGHWNPLFDPISSFQTEEILL